MKFKELIDSVHWEFIEDEFRSWYYKDKEASEYQLDGYRKVFDELKMIEPKDTDMRIYLKLIIWDEFENKLEEEPYVIVDGKNGKLQKESEDFCYFQFKDDEDKERIGNEEISWGIEFEPWDIWLGMSIDEDTLKEFTKEEIVTHCLWEMTFCGYDQEDIQEQMNELQDRVKEIENMSEEELKENTLSLDDIKERLDKRIAEDDEDEEDDLKIN
jgi:hypothetical protein